MSFVVVSYCILGGGSSFSAVGRFGCSGNGSRDGCNIGVAPVDFVNCIKVGCVEIDVL